MKEKNKYLKFFLVMGLSVCCLTSCDKIRPQLPSEAPIALIYLIGNHSSSKKQDVDAQVKAAQVYSGFGNIKLIGIDGSPAVVQDDEGHIPGFLDDNEIQKSRKYYKKNKPYWETNFLKSKIKNLVSGLDFQADDPEVDTLASLHVAVNALNSMEASMGKDIKKEIIVYDTGLCTSGALNFLNEDCLRLIKCGVKIQENAEMKEKVDGLINKLYDQAEIPNLDGVTVTWYGLGNVDFPQPPLSKLEITNLKYIWGEILRKSKAVPSQTGGSDLEYGIFVSINGDSTVSYTQTVTPVIFWERVGEGPISETSSGVVPVESNAEPPKLTEEKLGFLPESSEFRSEEEARNVLQPYAKNLMNYPDMQILLVGTTADPNRNGGGKQLSLDRAQKVKDTLISLGVPENQLSVIGKGAVSPWYKDEWINGYFDQSIAKENRAVWILPADSAKAKEVLNED